MPHDVFISYSTEDKPAADAVCAIFEQNGIRCWIAPRDIMPGADWGGSIVNSIRASRVLLLVFSTNANKSVQIKREVEIAADSSVTIVPLRIENILPTESFQYFLGNIHWLDALSPPLEKHLEEVATKVKAILGSDSANPPQVSPPSEKVKLGSVQRSTNDTIRPVWRRPIFIVGTFLALVLLIWFAFLPDRIPDLSGVWSCNDGAIYTIRQDGRRISWSGSNPPHFENLFDGWVTDDGHIKGNWRDLPGYSAYSAGELTLKIENPSRLVVISQTGNFFGSIWTKR
jgi:TIR domain